MGGLANAFRTPEVAAAIRASGDLGIAMALIQRSDNRRQYPAVDWSLVDDGSSARAFADRIAATPRLVVGGGTAIGGAGAFVIANMDFQSYANAIIAKLIRGISGAPYAACDGIERRRRQGAQSVGLWCFRRASRI